MAVVSPAAVTCEKVTFTPGAGDTVTGLVPFGCVLPGDGGVITVTSLLSEFARYTLCVT